MLLWQMFSDYDLQWKDEVPIKGRPYHHDLEAKSELLGIDFQFYWSHVMGQKFMMALGKWTTAEEDQAPDFIFLGNVYSIP